MKNLKEKRAQFMDNLRKFFMHPNVRITDEVSDDTVIVVTRVEDWDSENNDLWRLVANKSFPVDVVCRKCLNQVVMSKGMYKRYTGAGRKAAVECGKCVLGI